MKWGIYGVFKRRDIFPKPPTAAPSLTYDTGCIEVGLGRILKPGDCKEYIVSLDNLTVSGIELRTPRMNGHPISGENYLISRNAHEQKSRVSIASNQPKSCYQPRYIRRNDNGARTFMFDHYGTVVDVVFGPH